MSIPNEAEKINMSHMPVETFSLDSQGRVESKGIIKRYFLAFLILLVSVVSFGLGKLSATTTSHLSVSYDPSLSSLDQSRSTTTPLQTQSKSTLSSTQPAAIQAGVESLSQPSDTKVSASSKGTKYYYSYCKSNISAKNKIMFESKEMAESAGYTLAANCKPR